VTPIVDDESWSIKYSQLVKMREEDSNDEDNDGSEAKLNVQVQL